MAMLKKANRMRIRLPSLSREAQAAKASPTRLFRAIVWAKSSLRDSSKAFRLQELYSNALLQTLSKYVTASEAHVPSVAWGKQSPSRQGDCLPFGYASRSPLAAAHSIRNDILATEQYSKKTCSCEWNGHPCWETARTIHRRQSEVYKLVRPDTALVG